MATGDAAFHEQWPAQLLRSLLAEDRERGYTFTQAWSENRDYVLGQIGSGRTREWWRDTFESTRAVWEAAYNREAGPGFGFTPTMMDELNGDRRVAVEA